MSKNNRSRSRSPDNAGAERRTGGFSSRQGGGFANKQGGGFSDKPPA